MALEVRMRLVGFPGDRKTPHPVRAGNAMCKTLIDQPFQHPVDSHPVKPRAPEHLIDVMVRERPIRSQYGRQNLRPRRRQARAGRPNSFPRAIQCLRLLAGHAAMLPVYDLKCNRVA